MAISSLDISHFDKSESPASLEALRSSRLVRLAAGAPGELASGDAKPLPLGIDAVDRWLPDGGLPLASVVEMTAPAGLGRITQLALAACASAQRRSSAWCAWVDGSRSLYAPGVARAGVDLERLLVARPPPGEAGELARIAVRMVASRLFSLVVIDRAGVPGAEVAASKVRWNVAVRRLALAAEGSDTVVLLLSNSRTAARQQLPTALEIELSRPSVDRLHLCITKDRRGRLGGPIPIPIVSLREPAFEPSEPSARLSVSA